MKAKESFLDSLIELANNGSIDRRNFLKLASAAGITFASAQKGMAMPVRNCLKCHSQAPSSFTPDPITGDLMNHAKQLGIDLVWDRGSPCQFSHKGDAGAAGLCCFRCQMGPCTLGDTTNTNRGTCGATVDIIAARDLVRRIAGGTSAHIEHARAAAKILKGIALGTISDYSITDYVKLNKIYAGLSCTGSDIALAVAEKCLEDLGKSEGMPAWLDYKARSERKTTWGNLEILPTGGSAEICEAEHRTTMGVDADMTHLATDGLKLGLVDGYCGLHMATDLQDVLFGTPMLVEAKANLTVIEAGMINLIVHGHEPILSEKILEAAENYPFPPAPINIVGMCCTGNELLMRKGVNLAGSMVQQELAIITGAVEAMVVDVQCVIPNIQRVASNFHTKIITTNPHAKITGATHIEFEPENADSIAQQIVQTAVNNYWNRNQSKIHIPSFPPTDIVAGFSVEQIIAALKALNPLDPLKPLIDNIAANNIRGIVGIVGCVMPRDTYGYRHVTITKKLLSENILVVGTGCWAHVAGQYGLLTADPAYPGVGDGLKAVLGAVASANRLMALPACWHMGSCVDNSRIEDVLNAVADYLGVMISQLPVAASAPEFITEKAVAIGTWAVDLGLFTHVGSQPYVSGSQNLVELLTNGVEGLTGGKFYVEQDPEEAAGAIIAKVNEKRQDLGLPV
ncbi:MAG: anaerobic carbon-monoxide dehydrogenase catalytic subunit [Thermodesulfobacteriota bacterium]|nr:anaerobic carbon-monoxide dehydrogenase catalytic subunit [Thermodesulfobacteriota bacterium]